MYNRLESVHAFCVFCYHLITEVFSEKLCSPKNRQHRPLFLLIKASIAYSWSKKEGHEARTNAVGQLPLLTLRDKEAAL